MPTLPLPFATFVVLALSPATAAHAPTAIVYRGATRAGGLVKVRVAGGTVVRAEATVARYACRLTGDIGPLRVVVRPGAKVRAGRLAFTAGPPSERLTLRARLRHGRLHGRLRVRGTIATGDPCASRTERFGAGLVSRR